MQTETVVIKGQQYRLMKLSPIEGGRLATLVAQQLAGALEGGAIKELMQGYLKYKEAKDGQQEGAEQREEKSLLDMLMDDSAMLSAIAGGISKVNGEGLYQNALKCIRGNLFATAKLHDDNAINNWFAEHPDHLLLVLIWALRVNCAGFFGLGGKA